MRGKLSLSVQFGTFAHLVKHSLPHVIDCEQRKNLFWVFFGERNDPRALFFIAVDGQDAADFIDTLGVWLGCARFAADPLRQSVEAITSAIETCSFYQNDDEERN